MKKYISLLLVGLVAFLASCSNDDITISKTVNFTVNPSTVISTFSAGEEKAGELESFGTDCKLNVRLYIYDGEGTLVKEFSNTYSNYAVQFKASSFLPQGNYTAVAITHIDDIVDNVKYWTISGEQKLEGLRITDAGYIGGQNKVLGVAVSSFEVGDDIVDLNINVKPAGSMLTVRYYDYRLILSYKYSILALHGNKTMDYLEFDRSGNTEVVADNHGGEFDWIVDYLDVSTSEAGYTYYYNYEYFLPMTNVGLQFFCAENSDNIYSTDVSIGNSTVFNTQAGSCYYAYLYMSSLSSDFGNYSSRTRGMVNDGEGIMYFPIDKKSQTSLTKGQTLKIKDLI